jgi:hypothetical protein
MSISEDTQAIVAAILTAVRLMRVPIQPIGRFPTRNGR